MSDKIIKVAETTIIFDISDFCQKYEPRYWPIIFIFLKDKGYPRAENHTAAIKVEWGGAAPPQAAICPIKRELDIIEKTLTQYFSLRKRLENCANDQLNEKLDQLKHDLGDQPPEILEQFDEIMKLL